jgi:hypothetical protein
VFHQTNTGRKRHGDRVEFGADFIMYNERVARDGFAFGCHNFGCHKKETVLGFGKIIEEAFAVPGGLLPDGRQLTKNPALQAWQPVVELPWVSPKREDTHRIRVY